MNTGELAEQQTFGDALRRVLEIQTKLHRWATDDSHRRFDDLFNLVTDPAFLLVAWDRVRGNKGARTPGVDGRTAASIEGIGVEEFLGGLRASLKDRSFTPMPSRERLIPKAGGKLRRLGISTVTDRVVQASLKLVLEPIFEADFYPCSYGFRPKRRARDAVADVMFLAERNRFYEWIVEGDIKACFDEISHSALMDRVRARIADKRMLALVKAFLKAGILTEDKLLHENNAGTPQGSILSPVLSNVALTVLDEHIAHARGGPNTTPSARVVLRSHGRPTFQLVRYADDWCLMVKGTREHAEALRDEIAGVLAAMGLRLSEEKTLITHIDEGLDFLGWHIQRHQRKGGSARQRYVYPYPSKKALASIMEKIKTTCQRTGFNLPLAELIHRLNPVIQGWCAYFQPGMSHRTFQYLRSYLWRCVWSWIRRKHPKCNWKELRRMYCGGGWWPRDGEVVLFNPGAVKVTRYRYRGRNMPNPWTGGTE